MRRYRKPDKRRSFCSATSAAIKKLWPFRKEENIIKNYTQRSTLFCQIFFTQIKWAKANVLLNYYVPLTGLISSWHPFTPPNETQFAGMSKDAFKDTDIFSIYSNRPPFLDGKILSENRTFWAWILRPLLKKNKKRKKYIPFCMGKAYFIPKWKIWVPHSHLPLQ